MMRLTAEDRAAIGELIAMHGHLCDDGDLEGLDAVCTPSVIYDVTALGGGVLEGLAGLREAALTLGDLNPVGHHVTNVIIRETQDGAVHARSKGLGVNADGTVGSVTYDDRLIHTGAGWRISHRVVSPRNTALGGRRA
jgi:3-phenylpropionate/cinnamic acid dioxygenase small subunit